MNVPRPYHPLRWSGSTPFVAELKQPFTSIRWSRMYETSGYNHVTFLRADGTGIHFWNQMQTIEEQLEVGVLTCDPIRPDRLGSNFLQFASEAPRAATLLVIHESAAEAESGIVLTFADFEVTIVADEAPCSLSFRLSPPERFLNAPDHFRPEYPTEDYTRLRVIPVT